MGRAWRALAAAVGISLRADRARTIWIFVLSLLSAFTGVLTAYALKVIVDAAAAGDEGGALTGAVAVAVVAAVGMLAGSSVTRMMFPVKEHSALLLDQRLIELVGGTATIEHHERPAYLARIDVLRREGHVLAWAGVTTAGSIEGAVEVLATGLLLASVDPVLLAFPLFALPSLWAGVKAERLRQSALEQTADHSRRARHFFELATSAAPAKELRVYGLGSELLGRHRDSWRRADATLDAAAVRGLLWTGGGWLCFAVAYAGAVGLVVRGVVTGTASIGDVVLALTLIAQINEQVAGVVGSVTRLGRTVTVASRYLWLIDYTSERKAPVDDPPPPPERLVHGIELRDVAFRYPEGVRDVLAGVDLLIPAGSTVALVGENGAGKSTLVKLLCRLYEPTTGTVLVDGVDQRRFDVEEWRARMSAAFQDHVHFELLARETVGVGDLAFIDDVATVHGALERAGASEVVDRLPAGLETPLGTSFEGGAELSGGQWQKLSLARAMMRPAPLLLVLDEPTAALDADAEHALFRRYASAARHLANERGAITVLVSHRFSSVYLADVIVVVDGGRVVEVGSHAELLAAGGLYAELYELQASSYR